MLLLSVIGRLFYLMVYIGIACCYLAIGDSTFPMLSSIVLSWYTLRGIRSVYK